MVSEKEGRGMGGLECRGGGRATAIACMQAGSHRRMFACVMAAQSIEVPPSLMFSPTVFMLTLFLSKLHK